MLAWVGGSKRRLRKSLRSKPRVEGITTESSEAIDRNGRTPAFAKIGMSHFQLRETSGASRRPAQQETGQSANTRDHSEATQTASANLPSKKLNAGLDERSLDMLLFSSPVKRRKFTVPSSTRAASSPGNTGLQNSHTDGTHRGISASHPGSPASAPSTPSTPSSMCLSDESSPAVEANDASGGAIDTPLMNGSIPRPDVPELPPASSPNALPGVAAALADPDTQEVPQSDTAPIIMRQSMYSAAAVLDSVRGRLPCLQRTVPDVLRAAVDDEHRHGSHERTLQPGKHAQPLQNPSMSVNPDASRGTQIGQPGGSTDMSHVQNVGTKPPRPRSLTLSKLLERSRSILRGQPDAEQQVEGATSLEKPGTSDATQAICGLSSKPQTGLMPQERHAASARSAGLHGDGACAVKGNASQASRPGPGPLPIDTPFNREADKSKVADHVVRGLHEQADVRAGGSKRPGVSKLLHQMRQSILAGLAEPYVHASKQESPNPTNFDIIDAVIDGTEEAQPFTSHAAPHKAKKVAAALDYGGEGNRYGNRQQHTGALAPRGLARAQSVSQLERATAEPGCEAMASANCNEKPERRYGAEPTSNDLRDLGAGDNCCGMQDQCRLGKATQQQVSADLAEHRHALESDAVNRTGRTWVMDTTQGLPPAPEAAAAEVAAEAVATERGGAANALAGSKVASLGTRAAEAASGLSSSVADVVVIEDAVDVVLIEDAQQASDVEAVRGPDPAGVADVDAEGGGVAVAGDVAVPCAISRAGDGALNGSTAGDKQRLLEVKVDFGGGTESDGECTSPVYARSVRKPQARAVCVHGHEVRKAQVHDPHAKTKVDSFSNTPQGHADRPVHQVSRARSRIVVGSKRNKPGGAMDTCTHRHQATGGAAPPGDKGKSSGRETSQCPPGQSSGCDVPAYREPEPQLPAKTAAESLAPCGIVRGSERCKQRPAADHQGGSMCNGGGEERARQPAGLQDLAPRKEVFWDDAATGKGDTQAMGGAGKFTQAFVDDLELSE